VKLTALLPPGFLSSFLTKRRGIRKNSRLDDDCIVEYIGVMCALLVCTFGLCAHCWFVYWGYVHTVGLYIGVMCALLVCILHFFK
jgi:hypothetical protein